MPDVAIKLFSNRVAYNGSAVVTVDKLGGTQILHRDFTASEAAPNASGLAAYMDRRFDDPTYYTA